MGGVYTIFIEFVLIPMYSDRDLVELASKGELNPATAEDVQWKTAAICASLSRYAGGACKNGQINELYVIGLQG